MRLLIDHEDKEAFRSLTDDHPARISDFTVGDVVSLSVALLTRIVQQWDVNIFAPIDVTDWIIRAAIGGFFLPVSGTFPVSYAAETSDILLSYNPTAGELEDSLNSIPGIVTLGGLDVVGEEGFFIITWRLDEHRGLIHADPGDLVPLSVIEIEEVVAGDVGEREVQTLRIRQNVGALVTLTEDSASPVITVTLVTQGDATHNHKVRLTFPPDRWNGSWTFSALGETSVSVNYSPSQEQVETAIGMMAAVGLGNVQVTQEDENNFLVMFKSGRGNQAITGISSDGTTLKVIGTKSGDLDLRGGRMDFLIPTGQNEVLTALEIEATPDGGLPEKVLHRDVILNRAVISVGATVPPSIPGTYTLHNLDGFTGGGETKVDGAAHTVGKALGSIFRGIIADVLYEWELQAGTAVSSAPGVIRPTDYNALTNPVNLILVGS